MLMSALLDYVMPDVPSCPEALATDKLRLAAREFFSRSALWRVYFNDLDTVIGQRQYALTPDSGLEADVTGIAQVWYRGTRIWPRSVKELNEMYANLDTATGAPSYYNLASLNSVDLYPKPTTAVADSLKVWAILAPKTTSTYLRDEDNHWKEAIAAGAKAKLMMIQKKPYTDLELAMFWRKQFDDGVAEAKSWFASGTGDFVGGEITLVLDR